MKEEFRFKPTDPSTYQYTDEEWKEICKKDALTTSEIWEAARRNGVGFLWCSDIYVSSVMSKESQWKCSFCGNMVVVKYDEISYKCSKCGKGRKFNIREKEDGKKEGK